MHWGPSQTTKRRSRSPGQWVVVSRMAAVANTCACRQADCGAQCAQHTQRLASDSEHPAPPRGSHESCLVWRAPTSKDPCLPLPLDSLSYVVGVSPCVWRTRGMLRDLCSPTEAGRKSGAKATLKIGTGTPNEKDPVLPDYGGAPHFPCGSMEHEINTRADRTKGHRRDRPQPVFLPVGSASPRGP